MSHAVRNNAAVVPVGIATRKVRAKSHCQLTATSGASKQTRFIQTSGEIRFLSGSARLSVKLLLAGASIMR